MPEPQPRNLRVVRQINRRDILFSVARLPDCERLLVASSENRVYELDAAQNNPEARPLADHGYAALRTAIPLRFASSSVSPAQATSGSV